MTVIAIDGPAGSGKSTIAATLARRLGLPHVDTGAFYRAAALAVLRAQVDPRDAQACAEVIADAEITRVSGRTFLDGVDVEEEIRGPAVTAVVPEVARHPQVRAALLSLQQGQIGVSGAVVEGRDAGTVVAPQADLKVWLTARPDVRAARRAAQWGDSGSGAADHAQWLARRDAIDAANMAKAHDVVEVDTSDRGVDEVVDEITGLAATRPRADDARGRP